MNKSKKNNMFFIIMLILCIAVVSSSFLIPDILLKNQSQKDAGTVIIAPESYYVESGNAMARNTSSNLTSIEQIKLISGTWESTCSECTTDQGFLSENEAVSLARYSLNDFCDIGVFPYSASSNYNNWCSWDAKLYCYTDNLFNTYSAYLWVITFTKFDNSTTHTVYMTENGVIIGAISSDVSYDANKIISVYTNSSIKSIFADEDINLIEKKPAPEGTIPNIALPDTDFSNVDFQQIYTLQIISSDGELENYYVYQYTNDEIYGIGLSPIGDR